MNCESRIRKATLVNGQLSNFLSDLKGSREFVSLGQNCSTAWYLKAAGLKSASYPFDWIFSSTAIVADCIKGEFTAFMDRRNMIDYGTVGGHAVYHKHFFYHRNPLVSDIVYAYYERCCKRFNQLVETGYQPVFVVTLLPEVDKRSAWRDGFTQNFPLPSVKSEESILMLSTFLEGHFRQFKLIVFEQWTEKQPEVSFELHSTNTAFIKFSAVGKNGGVRFHDAVDDSMMITLLKGLKESKG